jgi:hypothetical protein
MESADDASSSASDISDSEAGESQDVESDGDCTGDESDEDETNVAVEEKGKNESEDSAGEESDEDETNAAVDEKRKNESLFEDSTDEEDMKERKYNFERMMRSVTKKVESWPSFNALYKAKFKRPEVILTDQLLGPFVALENKLPLVFTDDSKKYDRMPNLLIRFTDWNGESRPARATDTFQFLAFGHFPRSTNSARKENGKLCVTFKVFFHCMKLANRKLEDFLFVDGIPYSSDADKPPPLDLMDQNAMLAAAQSLLTNGAWAIVWGVPMRELWLASANRQHAAFCDHPCRVQSRSVGLELLTALGITPTQSQFEELVGSATKLQSEIKELGRQTMKDANASVDEGTATKRQKQMVAANRAALGSGRKIIEAARAAVKNNTADKTQKTSVDSENKSLAVGRGNARAATAAAFASAENGTATDAQKQRVANFQAGWKRGGATRKKMGIKRKMTEQQRQRCSKTRAANRKPETKTGVHCIHCGKEVSRARAKGKNYVHKCSKIKDEDGNWTLVWGTLNDKSSRCEEEHKGACLKKEGASENLTGVCCIHCDKKATRDQNRYRHVCSANLNSKGKRKIVRGTLKKRANACTIPHPPGVLSCFKDYDLDSESDKTVAPNDESKLAPTSSVSTDATKSDPKRRVTAEPRPTKRPALATKLRPPIILPATAFHPASSIQGKPLVDAKRSSTRLTAQEETKIATIKITTVKTSVKTTRTIERKITRDLSSEAKTSIPMEEYMALRKSIADSKQTSTPPALPAVSATEVFPPPSNPCDKRLNPFVSHRVLHTVA